MHSLGPSPLVRRVTSARPGRRDEAVPVTDLRGETRKGVLRVAENLVQELLDRDDCLLEAVLYKTLYARGYRMATVESVIRREVEKKCG